MTTVSVQTLLSSNLPVGATGISGFSGTSGFSGISGFSGTNGTIGTDGATGATGVSGFSGTNGTIGTDGATGATGTSGFSGISGFSGEQGISGFSGTNGTIGTDGATGATGTSGFSGISGYSGIDGVSGFSGVSGYSGIDGVSGFSGVSGYSGIDGVSGFSGYSGISGFSGTSGFSGLGISGFSGFSGSKSVVTVSDTAPVAPIAGELWWNSDTGNSYIRYDDASSNQWVLFSTVATENPDTYSNTIWSWGTGSSGQLGDNTIVSKSSPVSVVGGFIDWCQISSGKDHSLAVRTNGTAWSWGGNGQGELGINNQYIPRSSPVSVIGGFTDWCQVSAGNRFSLAVRQNGTAWAWGYNIRGQLGINSCISRSSPVSVVGGFTDWCQISAGDTHSMAVRQNGTAWGWGRNYCGQLGSGNTGDTVSPVSVVGGFTDWCQISAGGVSDATSFSVAVRQNGSAWAWGSNSNGALGNNGAGTFSTSPVSVVGGFTNWCQVSGGGLFALGVRTNGSLWGWGLNTNGRIGDNTTAGRVSPVSVVGGFTDWCQVSTSFDGSAAVRQNGTAWGWGKNTAGKIGDNTTVDKSSPVSVVGGFTDWCQVSTGYFHSLGIRSTIV